MNNFFLIIRPIRPANLLLSIFFYWLGLAIAKYLGTDLDWLLLSLGFLCVLFIQLFTHYLYDYFIGDYTAIRKKQHNDPNFSSSSQQLITMQKLLLPLSLAFLTSAIILVITISMNFSVSRSVIFIMLISAFGGLLFSSPPFKLAWNGYGELIQSSLTSLLCTAFAFSLQTGGNHRLLAMTTFPLFLLHLSVLICNSFEEFASDLKKAKHSLLIRIGWQNGMHLHNLLILGAYFLFGISISLGFPLKIGVTAFFTLPIGIFQIWQMIRIAEGNKPNWILLKITSYALIFVTVYFIAYSFWIR